MFIDYVAELRSMIPFNKVWNGEVFSLHADMSKIYMMSEEREGINLVNGARFCPDDTTIDVYLVDAKLVVSGLRASGERES